MIAVRHEGPVAWVTLNRPEKLNALTREFWSDLVALLERLDGDPDTRVLVLHASASASEVTSPGSAS